MNIWDWVRVRAGVLLAKSRKKKKEKKFFFFFTWLRSFVFLKHSLHFICSPHCETINWIDNSLNIHHLTLSTNQTISFKNTSKDFLRKKISPPLPECTLLFCFSFIFQNCNPALLFKSHYSFSQTRRGKKRKAKRFLALKKSFFMIFICFRNRGI